MKALRKLAFLTAGLTGLLGCGDNTSKPKFENQLAGHSYGSAETFEGLDKRFEKAELLFDLDKDGAKDQLGVIRGLNENYTPAQKFTYLKLYTGKVNDGRVYMT